MEGIASQTLKLGGITIGGLLLTFSAFGQSASPFNPSGYIKDKEFAGDPQKEQVKETTTRISGITYRVFRSASGRILVPDSGAFKPADLEQASCSHTQSGQAGQVVFGRVERPLTGSISTYAEIIQSTIVARCGDSTATGNAKVGVAPSGEIGVRIKDESKQDSPTYKVFNQGLKPNVGVGAEF